MLYYLGEGMELKKDECKEYKTIEGALRAAAKNEALTVWDENGKTVGGLTDNVPEGALNANLDGGVPAFDENGHPVGTVDAVTAAIATGAEGQDIAGEGARMAVDSKNEAKSEKSTMDAEMGENGTNTKPEENEIIIPQGIMRVTVICDGTLNLRRSAEWGNRNICGRASRGQSYYVKAIHTIQGKKMVQTIDDIYLSGQSEHVKYEQL